jgi:NodT family efflux transporter outer membrane factor (OMF) lipoprotein
VTRHRQLGLIMALAAAASALSACMVGPSYKAPTPLAGAAAPLASLKPTAETPAAPPDAWWRLFNDPRLDGYIAEAFAANDDLKGAEAHLASARALLEASKAGALPATTLKAGAVRGRDPATDEILEIVGAKPESIWIYDDVFDVSYELDLFGRVRRAIAASRADAQAAVAARDAVRVTVAAETTRAYLQVCALGEQLAVARHSLDVVSHAAEITTRRREAGAGSRFDVVRAQGLVAQARAAIPPLEGQRRAALYQLADLLGRAPVKAPEEALACETAPRPPDLIPVGDGTGLLKRRPDIREADRRLAAATARIGIATADLYPRITLSSFYGGVATTTANLIKEPGLAWGVGPQIRWAFPNQTGPRARIAEAKSGQAAALADFDGTVLRALKETSQALAIYGAELDRRQALADAQGRAQTALDIAEADYRAGALPTLDLLTTEQTLLTAAAAAAASDASLANDQVSVFKALGGVAGSRGSRRPYLPRRARPQISVTPPGQPIARSPREKLAGNTVTKALNSPVKENLTSRGPP